MKADFESERAELAKRGARFCHNPREAVMEWNAIKSGFADAIECLRAGSFSIIEMSICRVRLERFMESFRHSLKGHPEVFDAESLRVLSQLEALTLEWIRQAAKTKGHRFVDTPGEEWMGAWQDFCAAYGFFSQAVEFALSYEELERSSKGKQKNAQGNGTAKLAILKASAVAATESSRKKPGTGEVLLKAHLLQHHQYKGGNPPAIGNLTAVARSTELAEELSIAVGTVSSFFKEWFKGRKHYDSYCERQDFGMIAFALRLMSGDVPPPELRHSLEEEARSLAEADE